MLAPNAGNSRHNQTAGGIDHQKPQSRHNNTAASATIMANSTAALLLNQSNKSAGVGGRYEFGASEGTGAASLGLGNNAKVSTIPQSYVKVRSSRHPGQAKVRSVDKQQDQLQRQSDSLSKIQPSSLIPSFESQ